jgi:hypothetical protein
MEIVTAHIRSFRLIAIFAFVVLAASGCGMKVTFKPPFPETATSEVTPGTAKYSAVLMYSSATMDGKPAMMTSLFKDRLLEQLRTSHSFTSVYGDDQALPERQKILLSVATAERMDYNNVLGAIKGFFIGASFFILSPVIPIYADYTTEIRLTVEKPDGSQRHYTGYASGESEHYFFSHGDYYPDLVRQVTDAALRDLSAKLIQDRGWLQK